MKIIGWIREGDTAACGSPVAEGDPFCSGRDRAYAFQGAQMACANQCTIAEGFIGRRLPKGNILGIFGHGPIVRDTVLGDRMNNPVRRLAAAMMFALLGLVSLVVADVVSQWLCSHFFACGAALACPIDVCQGDARLTILRLAVWVGPAIVFGISAFAFSRPRRSLYAWLGLLAALMVAHSIIIVASR